MSEQQQPKEIFSINVGKKYSHSDDEYNLLKQVCDGQEIEIKRLHGVIRSRPHPAPAFKRCCDSCINVPCKVLTRVPCLAQEKQENICEENGCTGVENCDEICQHSRLFSPLQMKQAKEEAARKAREKVLEDICQNCGGLADGGEQCKTCYVKSLRHHSEQAGDQQPQGDERG